MAIAFQTRFCTRMRFDEPFSLAVRGSASALVHPRSHAAQAVVRCVPPVIIRYGLPKVESRLSDWYPHAARRQAFKQTRGEELINRIIMGKLIISRPAQEDEVAMKLLHILSIVGRRSLPDTAD